MGEAAAIKGFPIPAPPLAPVSDDMQGECFRTPSASRRVTQCPLFPPVQHLFTAAGRQSAAAVNNIALLSSAMVSLSADREANGPEEAARWLTVSRFSSAILQLCQPIAVSAGRHMAWATMIGVIWLSHTAVAERERASLVQGPLAPDGLFGPRFSEVLAHQQSVRENRSRFGAILTRSSHQQAGRRRGPGRFQDSSPGAAAAAAADWVAVGRRVHMASGSPASKKRRPLEPLVARARGYGRLYRSPSSPHYSVEAVGAEEYGLFLDGLPQLSARPLSDRYACWQERNVTALSTMRLLGLMAAAHPVVPLGDVCSLCADSSGGLLANGASYVVVFTDASLTGWGGTCLSHSVGDEWRTPLQHT
ncbi:unnamed protein product [Boreogadus saida]